MNITRIREWTTTLRSGRFQQTDGVLAKVEEDATTYHCCLGVGCEIANVTKDVHEYEYEDDVEEGRMNAETHVYYGKDPTEDLAPQEFVEWLGLTMPPGSPGVDLPIDIPIDHLGRRDREGVMSVSWSCAGLNDQGFTFTQIADIIDYFGLGQPT